MRFYNGQSPFGGYMHGRPSVSSESYRARTGPYSRDSCVIDHDQPREYRRRGAGMSGELKTSKPAFGTSPYFSQGEVHPSTCSYPPSICGYTLPVVSSTNSTSLLTGANTGRAALPNCLLPSVNELLSPRPPFPTRTSLEYSPQGIGVQDNDQSPRPASQAPRMSTGTPSSSSVVSGLSTTTSGTVQAAPSITERRYSLIVALYRICLEAAATYADSIRRPGHRRGAHGTGQGARGHRYHPYRQSPSLPSQWRSQRTHGGGEQTLMDCISVICTWLWRRARSDLMAPHEAESLAVREMKSLYDWSEDLVEHVEAHDPENDVGEGDSETDIGSLDDGITDQRAGNNATRLCRYFRDREALTACERVCLELGDLSREARRMGVTADDSADALGEGS